MWRSTVVRSTRTCRSTTHPKVQGLRFCVAGTVQMSRLKWRSLATGGAARSTRRGNGQMLCRLHKMRLASHQRDLTSRGPETRRLALSPQVQSVPGCRHSGMLTQSPLTECARRLRITAGWEVRMVPAAMRSRIISRRTGKAPQCSAKGVVTAAAPASGPRQQRSQLQADRIMCGWLRRVEDSRSWPRRQQRAQP